MSEEAAAPVTDNAATEAAPAPATLVSDAPATTSFQDSLGEFSGDDLFTKFDSPEALAGAYKNAQRFIGGEKLPMPQIDSDFELIYDKLGRPEDASGYEFSVPEGMQPNEAMQSAMGAAFHQAGLNPKQAGILTDVYNQMATSAGEENTQAQEQSINDATAALQKEWGQAYEPKIAAAQKALAEFGGDELVAALEGQTVGGVPLGNHPAILNAFANIAAKMMGEKGLVGDASVESNVLTPAEAKAEATTLMTHEAYFNANHPEHNQVMKKVTDLFKVQYPEVS